MTAGAARHGEVSAALGSLSDERLGALLAAATLFELPPRYQYGIGSKGASTGCAAKSA
ncbi:hypothetical protein [Amycolatopsis minnesotensis]|uniref:Uncharacterized protein n=1 Tax=Amycolatopsis minnesotensis TaxID=337894 RepID=A0ABP5BP36_9PSEU